MSVTTARRRGQFPSKAEIADLPAEAYSNVNSYQCIREYFNGKGSTKQRKFRAPISHSDSNDLITELGVTVGQLTTSTTVASGIPRDVQEESKHVDFKALCF